MGYILLGHGSFEVDPTLAPHGMEIVAIPQGITLQFYTDPGQQLIYSPYQLEVWEWLQAPWPPLTSDHVTYNLSLHSAWDLWEDELRDDPRFGGHELIRAGIGDVPDPIRLCTGTPLSCPTTPAQIAGGKKHTCQGIFGREDFQGADLYWLACIPLDGLAEPRVLKAVQDGKPRKVVLGDDPDRALTLGESDLLIIDGVNGANIARARHGEVLPYWVAGVAFFVDAGHRVEDHKYTAVQHDVVEGELVILKDPDQSSPYFSTKVTGPVLVIEVHDAPPQEWGLIQASLARCAPGADVYFVTASDETSIDRSDGSSGSWYDGASEDDYLSASRP